MLSVLICKDLKLSQEYNADESVYLFTIVLPSFCAIKVNTMPFQLHFYQEMCIEGLWSIGENGFCVCFFVLYVLGIFLWHNKSEYLENKSISIAFSKRKT